MYSALPQDWGQKRAFCISRIHSGPTMYHVGRGGGARAAEEDAAARERPRPDAGEAHERQPEARGEGEGPAERESTAARHTLISPFSLPLFPIAAAVDRKRNETRRRRRVAAAPFKPPRKAKEEVETLEKKMQQLENELAQTQTNLETASHNLEEKEKALQNVCRILGWCALLFSGLLTRPCSMN